MNDRDFLARLNTLDLPVKEFYKQVEAARILGMSSTTVYARTRENVFENVERYVGGRKSRVIPIEEIKNMKELFNL